MRGLFGALGWMIGGGLAAAAVALAIVGLGERSDLPAVGLATPPQTSVAQAERRACPPTLALPPRPAGAPVDDVFGVRAGMSVEDAQKLLLCADPAFGFQYERFWHTAVPTAAGAQRQLMYARRPGQMITVGLVGAPGAERSVALWRDQSYGLSEAPAMAALEQELSAQYGPPHGARSLRMQRTLTWSFAPDGRVMAAVAPAPSGGFIDRLRGMFARPPQTAADCQRTMRLTWLAQPTPNPLCGVTIQAVLDAQLDDGERVSRLRLAIMDQANLARSLASYRAANPQ